MDINGWSVIERLLIRRRKNQNDLARLLKVSPAAITQSKQGEFQLGLPALEKIINYLGATHEEQEEFYSKIVQNRIFNKSDSNIICHIIIIRRDEPEKE
ncbi:MAG: helix-turn-helix transcriptional regulator [Lentisphaeria bacterium]|nr:helix-turn-helix transcriptional regulator [Lentisphaeria bacterium]